MSPEKGRYNLDRILQYAPDALIGRDDEKRLISTAWAQALRAEAGRPHLLTFVALGGEGKTSLVAKWAIDELLDKGWPGCEAAFAWSFYSQGTRDQVAASSDAFLKAALDFFANDDADRAFAASATGAYEKGQRLARLVGSRRSLLILDGLEPLQYAPSAPTPGELKDQGIAALLKGLAQQNRGLCLVTTRYSVPDLKAFRQSTAPERELKRLSRKTGTNLLTTLGVKGTKQELHATVDEVKGHALTLQLLGSWLRDAHYGDIRQRHLVKLEEADAEEQGGHAFRVIAAYETSFEREGESGRRALALLRLLGLFDRPVTADCFDALRQPPAIDGLTDPLQGLSTPLLNKTLSRLESAHLLTVHRETGSGSLLSLDAHPLLREYFARQLREQNSAAWNRAHDIIYQHLSNITAKRHPTLEDLIPLYQAIFHGAQANKHKEALHLFNRRILQDESFYSVMTLGAFQSDLGAISLFFDDFNDLKSNTNISGIDLADLLKHAGYCYRALNQLSKSEAALSIAIEQYKKLDGKPDRSHAIIIALGLRASTRLFMGKIKEAQGDTTEQERITNNHTLLPWELFTAASRLAEVKSHFLPWKDSRTFYVAALQKLGTHPDSSQQDFINLYKELINKDKKAQSAIINSLARWVGYCAMSGDTKNGTHWCQLMQKILATEPKFNSTLHDGLLHLFAAQINLSKIRKRPPKKGKKLLENTLHELERATNILQRSQIHQIPYILLARAEYFALKGQLNGNSDSAHTALTEAWDIAQRGPMRLHLADIHLYRARLFFREARYPWQSPEADLAAARDLIERCGYGRRREELADAEAALAQWRQRPAAGG